MLDKKDYKTINMGEKSAYIEKNEGTVNLYHGEQQSLSTEEILLNINNASVVSLLLIEIGRAHV